MAKKHKALPRGVNYAQALAEEKRQKDARKKFEREVELRVNAEIAVQRALWLSAVSVADAYGLGPKRMAAYFQALQENSEEFDRMVEDYDYEYALEKLRLKAEQVTGAKLDYLYEKEMREMEKKKGEG